MTSEFTTVHWWWLMVLRGQKGQKHHHYPVLLTQVRLGPWIHAVDARLWPHHLQVLAENEIHWSGYVHAAASDFCSWQRGVEENVVFCRCSSLTSWSDTLCILRSFTVGFTELLLQLCHWVLDGFSFMPHSEKTLEICHHFVCFFVFFLHLDHSAHIFILLLLRCHWFCSAFFSLF